MAALTNKAERDVGYFVAALHVPCCHTRCTLEECSNHRRSDAAKKRKKEDWARMRAGTLAAFKSWTTAITQESKKRVKMDEEKQKEDVELHLDTKVPFL